jgi:hypothetical protein
MEVPEVRRRVRAAVEHARQRAAERRARRDEASRAYEQFLSAVAVPAFQLVAAALAGERHRFTVFTPAGSVRLAPERSADDFLELTLDSDRDPPTVLIRVSRGRGRRLVTSERELKPGRAIADLTEEDVVDDVLEEIAPFVER